MKRFIFMMIGIIVIVDIMAQSISKELATRVALQYMKNDVSNAAPTDYTILKRNNSIDTSYTQIFSPTGKAPLYLIQMPEGWILVASEYVKTPILASAPIGRFPETEDLPDGLKWLLSYYEEAMLYTHDNITSRNDEAITIWDNALSEQETIVQRDDVLPINYEIDSIRSFRWNQYGNNGGYGVDCNKVYNKFCPSWYTPSCRHTYVGCTAVAMGIVMRYHRWPHSAFIPNTIDSMANISVDKHLVTYCWDRMSGTIYNTTDDSTVDEIAGFLRDCGYASKMKYKASGSGASFANAMNALSNNFHYEQMSHVHRNSSYFDYWLVKLKSEIASNRPVIYAGYNYQINHPTGHAFVIYGYIPGNKFIIHWGWGNSTANDGFYSLDSLMPNGYYFNDYQEAIWGITPKYPPCDTLVLQQNDITEEYFEVYSGGSIIAPNITIHNNQSGTIFSGESVTLANGFKIEEGAEVYIDIRDMHCDDERNFSPSFDSSIRNIRHAPQQQQVSSSARKILRNNQILIIRGDHTYTLTGQEVK